MNQLQYLRKIQLIIADTLGRELDLSALRITFSITKKDSQTPNAAQINVYNLSTNTVSKIRDEFTSVIIQAGYDSNFGVIFKGTIKQVTVGKERGVDTYITIAAGDGDIEYNSAVVNTTLAAGSTLDKHIEAAFAPMYSGNITPGFVASLGGQKLPRAKVMFGPSKDYLRQATEAGAASWSIQDGKSQVTKNTEVLPGRSFVLNSSTGLIGAPQLTTDGLEGRCLLNPKLKIGGSIQIAEADIQTAQIPNTDTNSDDNNSAKETNPQATIATDGLYRVYTITHSGDTRGNDWYTDFTALQMDITQPANNQVANNG